MGGFQLPFIHINRITQRLKGIETDTNRQNNVKGIGGYFCTEKGEGCDKIFLEKIEVLEKPQDAQIKNDAGPEQAFPPTFTTPLPSQFPTNSKIQKRAKKDQGQEPPIPPTVKYEARYNDQKILQLKILLRNAPIEQKNHWEKNYKVYRVKEHFVSFQNPPGNFRKTKLPSKAVPIQIAI